MGDIVKCKRCKGAGKNREGSCVVCKGSGQVLVTIDKDGDKTIVPVVRK